MLKDLYKKITVLKELFFLSEQDKLFVNFSKQLWDKKDKNTNGELLVDQMFYDLYIFQLSYLTNYIKKEHNLESKHYHFIGREKKQLIYFFKYFRKFSRINKLYNSFGSEYGFGQKYFKKSEEICSKLKFSSKKELLNYKIEGILVGDLIYDTYLRTFEQPTVDLGDDRLNTILLNAHDIFYTVKEYLENHNVQKIIISHAVYIQYGILGRVALEKKIDVYNTHWERIIKKLSLDHFVPTPRHHLYRDAFSKLPNQQQKRLEAEEVLQSRFAGNIDRGIAYMKKSSFSSENMLNEKVFGDDGSTKVALLLHCFYDAPHIYQHMLFEDFYEWVNFVFSAVKDQKIDFVVKPHPNAKPFNKNIIEKLTLDHPYIKILDPNVTNKNIIEEGVDLVLTVYGTSTHEYAYHDVKVMTAGDHPGFDYNFSFTPQSKEEYKKYILDPSKLKINIKKEEILEFFYMHYLHPGSGRIVGNNDVFHVRTRDFSQENKLIFKELVTDAKNGLFNDAFSSFNEAFNQVD